MAVMLFSVKVSLSRLMEVCGFDCVKYSASRCTPKKAFV